MHLLFIVKCPDLADTVKYEYYLKKISKNFNPWGSRPQIDAYSASKASGIGVIDAHFTTVAKRGAAVEIFVHRLRANKVYTKLKLEISSLKGRCNCF